MAICSFTVAVDYGFGDNKGTNWMRCSIFGKRAEGQLPKYLVKGKQVAISGEMRVREYDDKEGNKRTSVEVSVDKLDLIGGQSDGGQVSATGSGQAASRPSNPDPFADTPNFGDVPVDDDIPF